MAEQRTSYVIIGSGIAGITACEVLRAEDAAAAITVVSDDPFPVYYRPALKDYLGGRVREDQLWARPSGFYQQQRVRLLANRVVGLQPDQHMVHLQNGEHLPYDRLLLATGASPRRMHCPGSDLDGVFVLRTVADYQRLLLHLKTARRVVVSGSGTLALETIETLRHRGYQVAHLIRHPPLWSDVLDQTASDLILQQERRDGVEVRVGEQLTEIIGKRGNVTGVVTTSGAQLPCDTVLIAHGIEPVIDFIKAAGITCGRGVQVDEAIMRTSAPDIYAAGDLLETAGALPGQTRLLGQWYPAIQQARAAAYSMLELLDTSHPFRFGAFYNATRVYGLDLAVVGVNRIPPNTQGYEEIVADPQPRAYQKVILKDGIPVGALLLGNRKRALDFKRAIDHQVKLREVAARLFADDFQLSAWLEGQQVPPPTLGVSREGAAAVRQVAYSGLVAPPSFSEPRPAAQAWLIQIPKIVLSEEQSETSEPAVGHPRDTLISQQSSALSVQQGAATKLAELRLSQTAITSIGRQAGASLRLSDHQVSRRHAEISYLNGQYLLRDLGSSNGTWVNEARLEPGSVHILYTRDRLRFGDTSWLFEIRPAEPEAEPVERGKTALLDVANLLSATSDSASPTSKQPFLAALRGQTAPTIREVVSAGGGGDLPTAPALVVVHRQQQMMYCIQPGKRLRIGRAPENDIMLADVTVSRSHAEVFAGPEGCFIRDLGSSNGVFVNRTQIDHPYRLSPGDQLLIGAFQLTFVNERSALQLVDERTPTLLLPMGGRNTESGTTTSQR